MIAPRAPGLLARLDGAVGLARSRDVAPVAWAGGALVAFVVLTIYYVEQVEGVTALRLPLALLLVLAWWGRAMLVARAARNVTRRLWDAPIPPHAGRAVDVLRTSMVVGLGLWMWAWLLVLGSLAGPIGVACVVPLFMLRGAIAPSWIARAACETDAGLRGFWRAIGDNDTNRALGVGTELLVLAGTFGLAINVYASTAVALVLARTFGGLDVASFEAFLSPSNTFVLLAIAAAALVAMEPLRAALSATAYVDARVREEGLDLRAAIQEAIEHASSRRGATRAAAAVLAAVVCAPALAIGQEPSGDREPPPVVAPADDLVVERDIDEILARPEFREFDDQRGAGLRDLIERLFEWLFRQNDEAPRIEGPNLGFIALPGAWFFIVMAGLLLAGVGVYLWTSVRRARAREAEGPLPSAAGLDPRERAPSSFLDEAARLAEAGDLRMALRALYLATLVALDRRQLITFDPHLTNWQYIRQLPRGATRDAFHGFTRVFDHKWYGEEGTTLAEYERCRGLAREIVDGGAG